MLTVLMKLKSKYAFYGIQDDIDICLPMSISSIFDICFYFYIIT